MGGGGGKREAREARKQAERTYELQKEQLELQKKQLAELEAKEKGKEAERQARLEELLKRKRRGISSTILTNWSALGEPAISRRSLYA